MAFLGDDRVVCDGVDFNLNLGLDISDRVLAGTMNLRNTTQGIRVLDPLLSSYGRIATAFQKVADIACCSQLSALRTDGMQVFFKWTGNTIVDLHGKGASDI